MKVIKNLITLLISVPGIAVADICTGSNLSGCDVMTIVTMGDKTILVEGLLAIAEIFGTGGLIDTSNGISSIGSVVTLPLMVSLVGILMAGINSQKVRVDYLLTIIILFSAMFVPKAPVEVYDMLDGGGAGGLVMDVPIGLALIGHVVSNVTEEVTISISSRMSPVASAHSNLLDDGFVNPLTELLTLRHYGIAVMPKRLSDNLRFYHSYCVETSMKNDSISGNDARFVEDEWVTHQDPMSYYFSQDNIFVNYITPFISNSGTGNSDVYISCGDASIQLSADINRELTGTGRESINEFIEKQLGPKTSTQSRDSLNPVGGGYAQAVDLIFNSTKTPDEFIRAQFMNNMKKYADLSENNRDASVASVMKTEAFERDKVGSAIEADVFLSYMFPAMSLMQFIFYVITPLIALLLLASGPHGLKIFAGFIMFGIWAHSWMPVAAVVNYWIEVSVANAMQQVSFDVTDWTAIKNFGSVYDIVSAKIGAGAKMLAATPIVAAGLLMGSPFAMSRLAESFTGSKYANPDAAARKLYSADPVVNTKSEAAENRSTGGMGLTHQEQLATGASEIKGSNVIRKSFEEAKERSDEARKQLTSSESSMASKVTTWGTGTSFSQSEVKAIRTSYEKAKENFVAEQRDFGISREDAERTFVGAMSKAGFDMSILGVQATKSDVEAFEKTAQVNEKDSETFRDGIVAKLGQELANNRSITKDNRAGLMDEARDLKQSQESFEKSTKAVETQKEALSTAEENGITTTITSDQISRHLANREMMNGGRITTSKGNLRDWMADKFFAGDAKKADEYIARAESAAPGHFTNDGLLSTQEILESAIRMDIAAASKGDIGATNRSNALISDFTSIKPLNKSIGSTGNGVRNDVDAEVDSINDQVEKKNTQVSELHSQQASMVASRLSNSEENVKSQSVENNKAVEQNKGALDEKFKGKRLDWANSYIAQKEKTYSGVNNILWEPSGNPGGVNDELALQLHKDLAERGNSYGRVKDTLSNYMKNENAGKFGKEEAIQNDGNLQEAFRIRAMAKFDDTYAQTGSTSAALGAWINEIGMVSQGLASTTDAVSNETVRTSGLVGAQTYQSVDKFLDSKAGKELGMNAKEANASFKSIMDKVIQSDRSFNDKNMSVKELLKNSSNYGFNDKETKVLKAAGQYSDDVSKAAGRAAGLANAKNGLRATGVGAVATIVADYAIGSTLNYLSDELNAKNNQSHIVESMVVDMQQNPNTNFDKATVDNLKSRQDKWKNGMLAVSQVEGLASRISEQTPAVEQDGDNVVLKFRNSGDNGNYGGSYKTYDKEILKGVSQEDVQAYVNSGVDANLYGYGSYEELISNIGKGTVADKVEKAQKP